MRTRRTAQTQRVWGGGERSEGARARAQTPGKNSKSREC